LSIKKIIIQKRDGSGTNHCRIVGNAVGIIGILAIVDIIRNWILGG
jgi:hypothetical protein